MGRNIEHRIEIIDGREFKVTVIPTKDPAVIRNQIGERPEGRIGKINKSAKFVGVRKY